MDDQIGESIRVLLAFTVNVDLPVTTLILAVVILIVMILLSGLLSGSEIAYFSLNKAKIDSLSGGRSLEIVKWLWNRPEKLLATILIYNNLVNIAIILLATWITGKLFFFEQYWIKFLVDVVIIAAIIVLFCELLPKILANIKPVSLARLMADPLRAGMGMLYPFISLLVRSTVFFDKRVKKKNVEISREELNEAINYSGQIANADMDEVKLLKGIINFGDKEVTEIMTSRLDVVGFDENDKFIKVLDVIRKTGFSRYPVYRDNMDSVIGVLHIKDILPFIHKINDDAPWQKKIRPIYVIPENKKIKDLLKEFQGKKKHIAVVVDEYGCSKGIITLEDVIEEIVGDISDEFDEDSDTQFYKQIKENLFEFEGKMLINDFLKILDLPDDYASMAKGEADTLAGFLLEMKGDMPKRAEKLDYKSLQFTIKEVDHRRIIRILVLRKEENDQED